MTAQDLPPYVTAKLDKHVPGDAVGSLADAIRRHGDDRAAEVRSTIEAVLVQFEQAAEAAPGHAYSGPWLAMVDDVRRVLTQ